MAIFKLAASVIKFILIAIVYVFILRVVKMVYFDISETKRARRKMNEGMAQIKYLGKKKDLKYKVCDSYAIREETFVGRAKENDVRISSPFMSAKHARIFFEDGEFYMEDLGSSNGTMLNGKDIGNYTVTLKSGDKIAFGELKFVFVENDAE